MIRIILATIADVVPSRCCRSLALRVVHCRWREHFEGWGLAVDQNIGGGWHGYPLNLFVQYAVQGRSSRADTSWALPGPPTICWRCSRGLSHSWNPPPFTHIKYSCVMLKPIEISSNLLRDVTFAPSRQAYHHDYQFGAHVSLGNFSVWRYLAFSQPRNIQSRGPVSWWSWGSRVSLQWGTQRG